MSWSGFKKAVDRAGTTMRQKTGSVNRTVDDRFNQEERRFRNLEAKSEDLHRQARGYAEAIREMSLAQIEIAKSISEFTGDTTGELSLSTRRYLQVVEELEMDSKSVLGEDFSATVLEPIGRYCSYFSEVDKSIKKRNRKLLDYDAESAKARKMASKVGDDRFSQYDGPGNQAQEVYEALNQQILDVFPKLVDARVDIVDPCFEAMLKAQYKFAQDAYGRLAAISQDFPPMEAQVHIDGRIDEVLGEMRSLTICGLV
ncbi:BAR-domain-containing protein [Basidiobolus meristosporus CBS 931.73]|uniref:BAR-domain-containing protein n=1 Tax=Basidiobolus meristosporus CBS 931.73 TaxID=1314790 RepID=A0A1Y1YH26_9FUNG|nr:BAR-domain-containing protein [Basidiobolus meristosporus CBS 931.73]|eukprot:ORX97312.1 BAR-domain-containing protein [Basidiobolus meristosporus CBS 931.73]